MIQYHLIIRYDTKCFQKSDYDFSRNEKLNTSTTWTEDKNGAS